MSTPFERIPASNPEKRETRGPSAAAIHKDMEHKDMMLAKLASKYREAQMNVADLERRLNEGIEHTVRSNNPQVNELAIKLGRELNEQIGAAREEKARLEEEMRKFGGNPEDYTVQ